MMSSLISLLPLLAAFVTLPATALDANGMRPRSVYQLVTDRFALPDGGSNSCPPGSRDYCGGTWNAVASKLDYIKGMGFDTIWISPVVENISGTTGYGEAYHGYWTLDPGKLNSHFGTAADLQSLSKALHAKGMYLMVDVVVNHVAGTSGSSFQPDGQYGPFSTKDAYHPYCLITDYTNQTMVEDCWLGDKTLALPDLVTESPAVANYWNSWVTGLVANYTIDAIRIDTVKHVNKAFWPNFVSAAGVFNQGEILDGDTSYVADYQNKGKVNPFNYPIYYPLTRAFNSTSGDLSALVNTVQTVKSAFNDPTLLGQFLNNHDNARFESITSDQALIKNAHTFPLVTDGIPYVYYGSEAGFKGGNDPDNREALWPSGYDTSSTMYKLFASLNAVRSAAGNASSSFYTDQMSVTALSKNDLLIVKQPLVSVLNNRGSSGSTSSNIVIPGSSSGWTSGTMVVDAISCQTYTTGLKGDLSVGITNGAPMVFIDSAKRGNVCAASELVAAKSDASSRWASIHQGIASVVAAAVLGGAAAAAL